MRRTIFLISVFFCAVTSLPAQNNVGKIIQVVNDVDITSLTTGIKTLPTIGSGINTDQKIRTGKRSFVEILLNNGTRIQMKDVSVLNISALKTEKEDPPTRMRLLTGKVQVSVKKLFRDGHTLILKTPTAIAGIRGTEFGVIASLSETKIIVFSGDLDVASSNQNIIKSFQMRSREESDILKDRPPSRPRIVPEEMINTWFDQYDIDESNRIILKKPAGEGFIDSILRKRKY